MVNQLLDDGQLFLSHVLLVGDGDTSDKLREQIRGLHLYEIHFIFCKDIRELRQKLEEKEGISIVILDADDKKLDIFRAAKIIEMNDETTRILVTTSREFSPRFYQDLINSHFVKGLIEIPIDDEQLELLITQIVAKYVVLKMMKEDVESKQGEQKKYANLFSGFVFTIYSLVKYAVIQDVAMREKEILIGSYLSSILDIMAPDVQEGAFTEFKLGNLEIISYNEGIYDYFFMFNDISPMYREHLKKMIPDIIQQMKEEVGEYFFDPNLVFDQDKEKIAVILNNNNLKLEQSFVIQHLHNALVEDKHLPIEFLEKEFSDSIKFIRILEGESLHAGVERVNPHIIFVDVVRKNYENKLTDLYHLSSQFPQLHFVLHLQEVSKEIIFDLFKVDLNLSLLLPNDKPSKIATIIHSLSSQLLTIELQKFEALERAPGMNLQTYLKMAYQERSVKRERSAELIAVQVLLDNEVLYSVKFKEEDIFKNIEIKNIVQSFKDFGTEITETNNIFSINIDKYTIYFMVILSYDILFIVESEKLLLVQDVGALVNEYNQEIVSLIMEHMVNQNVDFNDKMNQLVEEIRIRFCTL